jgi:hypothetical protein
MDSLPRRRRDRFLQVTPLTANEKRHQKRVIRVVIYADAAILLIFLLGFSKEWLGIVIAWWIVTMAVAYWYAFAIRRARLEKQIVMTDEERINIKKDLSKRAMKILPLEILGGAGFLGVGYFNPWAFALAGFVFATSLSLFIWARSNR